jgi:hypothetical protein
MLVASGMSQPTDQQCGRRVPRVDRLLRRTLAFLGGYLLLANAHCTFPEYNTPPVGAAGATGAGAGAVAGAGAGAGVGAGGTSQSGAGAGDDGGGDPGGGTEGVLGGAAGAAGQDGGVDLPECAPQQWPVDHCAAATCVRRYPAHCYDGKKSGDEVASDCGGGCHGCTNEACTADDDCLSGSCLVDAGACFAPLSIKYTSHEQSPIVGNTTWSISVLSDLAASSKGYAFKDLKVRYYFDRSGIVEPLLVRSTQSNLKLQNGQSRGLAKTSWTIQRVEHLLDAVYDAFVEVSFDEAGQLYPGDQIDLYQQLSTGDAGRSTFDQRANYSFTEATDLPWLHVTVFYKGRLVWGLEPPPANPRACFARGVNLNGPAVTVDSNPWQGASQAGVTTTGSGVSQATTPFPAVAGGIATMLNTVTRLPAGTELNVPTANGTYLAYLYATSPSQASDAEASLLTVQGEEPDSSQAFRSQTVDAAQAWARLGPYRVEISSGKLTIAVTKGAINFAGLELWYPE